MDLKCFPVIGLGALWWGTPPPTFLTFFSCQKVFDKLKTMLCHYPVLQSPNFNTPFSIAVDASDEAAGAVLLKRDIDDTIEHPVSYFSKKFNKHQRH